MADKLSVSDNVTKVYRAARDGSSNLTTLLKRLKTELAEGKVNSN